jgi:hypothetical protein
MSSPPPPDEWPSPPHPQDEGLFKADPDEDTGPVHVVTPPDDDGATEEPAAIAAVDPVEDPDEVDWSQAYYPRPAAQSVSYPSLADDSNYPPAEDDSEYVDATDTDAGDWPQAYVPPQGETFAGRFTAPLTVDPRVVPVKGRQVRLGPIFAGVAAVVIAGLAVWLVWPSSGGSGSGAGATTSATPAVDVEANAKLLRALPPGYASDACKAADLPNGAAAKVDCTANADLGGPPSASYTLLQDKDALRTAFDDVVRATSVVTCPGNIQSPGPWRRNATPDKVSGTLVCGSQQSLPTVAWTNDTSLLLCVVRASAGGPTLDQLYAWWSTHS